MYRSLSAVAFVTCFCAVSAMATGTGRADEHAGDPSILELDAPITTWDEGIPLGNGLTGGLLWGGGSDINVSLDRGDLWDERLPEIYLKDNWNYATIRRLKAEGNQAEISRLFDTPYNRVPYPTKLPGGRLVMHLGPNQTVRSFQLDMRQAIGRARLASGELKCFFSAVAPVAMLSVPGTAVEYEFVRPAGLDQLGYGPAEFGQADGQTWMVQEAALGLKYAVVVGRRQVGEETEMAVAITSNHDGADPLAIGRRRVGQALESGFTGLFSAHRRWWKAFWDISRVTLPDERIARHYQLVKYFYGAASRSTSPPMPLQAVWTRDDGNLPPWKGDYHHDLNTQMTYLAYHTAGLTESGENFLRYNWERLPIYEKFAQDFYGVQGAMVPGVATLAGKPTAGWSQYALSPTSGLWVGQSFVLHWEYTQDMDFLRNRAYPWLKAVADGVMALLEHRNGKLYLPLSSSPEIHNNSLRAWLTPNSNYDLALLQWTTQALERMARRLGKTDDVQHWHGLRQQLDDLLVDDQDVLMFAAGEPFNVSHRHHSHAMAIHPLGLLSVEGSERDRSIVNATLDAILAKGTQAWTGYSFSWFSCMLARGRRPEAALKYLVDYERAFILRNGFHANGDQIGAGLSHFRYRPFTLEGNFLAMEAVHEMLLQSWGGRLRVFPAVSKKWADVSFDSLHAQGGYRVSAERTGGHTSAVDVTATVKSELKMEYPFPGEQFTFDVPCEVVGNELHCSLDAGQTVHLRVKP